MSSALLLFISCAIDNQKGILHTIRIIIVVDNRENTMSTGINSFVEQYTRNNGFHGKIFKFINMKIETNSCKKCGTALAKFFSQYKKSVIKMENQIRTFTILVGL